MNTKSLQDLMKATRLTAAGRLGEATSLVRSALSGQGAGPPQSAAGPTIDMERAAGSGRWSAPDLRPARAKRAPAAGENILPAGARFDEHVHAGPFGTRTYKLYVPSRAADTALPLLVMLHGCTQSPDDFAVGTRMNALAEERGFLVAYPAQTKAANPARCWNWFNGQDQHRDAGEPAILAGLTREIIRDRRVDPARVFAAGLSAGGAAAAILGAAYPDLFAAIGVHSGLACGAARDVSSALAAMRHGSQTAETLGHQPGGRPVRAIVFHGDRDSTVNVLNGERVMAQFGAPTGSGDAQTTEGVSPGGLAYTRRVLAGADRRAAVEHWLVHGAGHAWSGGNAAGSFTEPRGPDASREMLRFFLETPV